VAVEAGRDLLLEFIKQVLMEGPVAGPLAAVLDQTLVVILLLVRVAQVVMGVEY
jgi:hypothetical protein